MALSRAIDRGRGVPEAQALLRGTLHETGKSVLFSDEMTVVATASSSWRQKLLNLGGILDGLDASIVITVREPARALFSYYIERLPRLGCGGISFEDFALRRPEAEIFHYRKFFDHASRALAGTRLIVVQFEELIRGNFGELGVLLGSAGLATRGATLPVLNTKVGDKPFFVVEVPISVATAARAMCGAVGISPRWLDGKLPYLAKVAGRLAKKRVARQRLTILRPSEDDFDGLRRALADETSWLGDNFGIDYLTRAQAAN